MQLCVVVVGVELEQLVFMSSGSRVGFAGKLQSITISFRLIPGLKFPVEKAIASIDSQRDLTIVRWVRSEEGRLFGRVVLPF